MNDITTLQIRPATNRRFTAHLPNGDRIPTAMQRNILTVVRNLQILADDGRFGRNVRAIRVDAHGRQVGRGWLVRGCCGSVGD